MGWSDTGPQIFRTPANFLQGRFKRLQLLWTRIREHFPDFGCVFAKDWRNQFFAPCRERHDANASILGALDAAHQASVDEAVNGRTDRSRRKVNLWTNRVHRQRSF